jgi:methylase of polypeptide subunit release factors
VDEAVDQEAAQVRAALLEHGFTADGVLTVLGADGFAALGRGEGQPARHALADVADEPLTDLIRLFLLGEAVPESRAAAAVPLPAAEAVGLIAAVEETAEDQVRARVHLQPYATPSGDAFVASDFPAWVGRPGGQGLRADHVVGIGGASVTLATITPRDVVASTLDLGTGCGVQALMAAGHSAGVVATDRSERALAMARRTAGLSGVAFDCRAGSLFEPVAGEAFDLIVANPPFVISPHARYVYREAPLRADDLSRTVVQQAAEHLRPGGVAVLLANWLHTAEQSWHDRLAAWAPVGTQMWVAQREQLTAPEYVEVWLRDAPEQSGSEHERRYAEWLTYFDDLAATGVGFGWIVLRRSDDTWFVSEDVSEAPRLPSGAEVLQQLADFSALHDASAVALLSARPQWRDPAQLHQSWFPTRGGDGELVAAGSWRPDEALDPVVAELLAAPGTLAERIERLAAGDAELGDDLTARGLVGIRRLIGAGLVHVAG